MDLRAKITDAVYDHPRADDQINAVMGVVEGRVRELEAENQKLRGDLEAATGFEFTDPSGNRPTVAVLPRGDGWSVVVLEADRDAVEATKLNVHDALSRARDIAKEEA